MPSGRPGMLCQREEGAPRNVSTAVSGAGEIRAEMTVSPDAAEAKPLLRGVLHQVAFFLSLGAGAVLIAGTSGAVNHAAAAVFGGAAAGMFGASALYHRVPWRPSTRRWMRRVDHAGVFLMIAGSYTAYGLVVLSGAWRIGVLAVVWSGACASIALRIVWVEAPGWLAATLAIAIGWVVVVVLPDVFQTLGPAGFGLLLSGGLLYTAGGVVYALRRPNPFPAVFGFHELFHALVVAGVACQYAALALLLLPRS
jgi:hemolysin III